MPFEEQITHNYIIDYIRDTLKKSEGILAELEAYAHKNGVPIVQKEVASFLETVCRMRKPMRVLEIGTAIGYSAILMLSNMPEGASIVSIERDETMARLARENIERAGLTDRITVVEADAEAYLKELDGEFDMIFMDAAKSHYIYFLPECIRLLKSGGVLVSDNILYGGMVANRALLIRRKITIVKRLKKYIAALCEAPELKTSLLSIGDGVSLSYKL
ncbi:MAG: O-methyltransferase [Clostridia bacterium]|nr:O-methyltransferase [Clostridia bacterium]